MLRQLSFWTAVFLAMFPATLIAQTPAGSEKQSQPKPAMAPPQMSGSLESRIEKYLRNLYAWGPSFEVKIGTAKPSPVADLLEVPVTVSMESRSDTASVYVSKDGKFLFRGELTDMGLDPFAEVRAKLHPENAPSMGPENAKITLIEFGDLECPSCRQLDVILRDLLPKNPDVRLVFKHFPLTDVHPWAMTAAIATQCAFHQSPAAFWKMHDAIYDSQDLISPSNAWDKMLDLGNQAGLNADAYKACMVDPETAKQVNQMIAEGHTLNVTATPTTFVNGRRVVGPDRSSLQHYLSFEHAD